MATRARRTARPGSAAVGGRRTLGSRAASADNERSQRGEKSLAAGKPSSDAENCLEAVRLRLHLLRSRMRDVKQTADAIKLTGSELQTEVRSRCGDLMRALEERQHVMVEAVISEQERKLDALQRQANSIDNEAEQLLKTEAELEANIVAAEAERLERKSGAGRGGTSQAHVPRALIEAMRAAVARRPEDEVHGPVPCTPAALDLTLATDALLRQLLSLDFQERQVLMAPENVAVVRETRHSLRIEWVAPPTIPSFPVCGYSVLVSEDDGTAEGGHPEEEMRNFQRNSGAGEVGAGERHEHTHEQEDRAIHDHDDADQYSDGEEYDVGYDVERSEGQQLRRQPERGSSAGRYRTRSADRSRHSSAFGSSLGHGAVSAAARRSRSADRARRSGASSSALTQESQSALAQQKLALAKQQRRGDRSTAAVRNQSSGGNGKESGNAPLLRFEAWGLKADTPYRFHIQAVNGQGRGLWGHDATMRTSSTREFVWKRDGDENGVLYWLGTGGPERRRHSYRNPAKDGKVAVVASHSVSSSTAHWMFVGRSNARSYIDCRHPGTWLALDLRQFALRPSRYMLRAGPVDAEAFRLKHWQLQGSSDGLEWVVLHNHNRQTLAGHFETGSWEVVMDDVDGAFDTSNPAVQICDGFFSWFRIVSLDPVFLCLSGIELYGTLDRRRR